MAYSFQTFTAGQKASAGALNQTEENARSHTHGVAGGGGTIADQFGARISVSSRNTLSGWPSTFGVVELEGGGIMSQRGNTTYWFFNAYHDGTYARTMVGSIRPLYWYFNTDGDMTWFRANSAATLLNSGDEVTFERIFTLNGSGTTVGTCQNKGFGTFANPDRYFIGTREVTATSLSTLATSCHNAPVYMFYTEYDYTDVADKFLQINSQSAGANGTVQTIGGSGSGASQLWYALGDLPSDTCAIHVRANIITSPASHNTTWDHQYLTFAMSTPLASNSNLADSSRNAVLYYQWGADSGMTGYLANNYDWYSTEMTIPVQSGTNKPIICQHTRSSSLGEWFIDLTLLGYYRSLYGA